MADRILPEKWESRGRPWRGRLHCNFHSSVRLEQPFGNNDTGEFLDVQALAEEKPLALQLIPALAITRGVFPFRRKGLHRDMMRIGGKLVF